MDTSTIYIKDSDGNTFLISCEEGSTDPNTFRWNTKQKEWIANKLIPYIRDLSIDKTRYTLKFSEIMTDYKVVFSRAEILTFLQTMMEKDNKYAWPERIILQSIRNAIIHNQEPFEKMKFNKL